MTQQITKAPSILLLSLLLTLVPPPTTPLQHPTNTQTPTRRRRIPLPISVLRSAPDDYGDDGANSDLDLGFDWRDACEDVFDRCERPVVLFDGVCKFCNDSVNYVLDNDPKGNFRFASLQSSIGTSLLIRSGKTPTDHSSIVVVTPTTSYDKSDAVLYIASRLDGNAYAPFVGKWSGILPRGLRNLVYGFVSRNRYRWGESDSCRVDLMEFEDRFVKDPVKDGKVEGEGVEDGKKKECRDA